jgi:transcriptional regulator with XRE-family HTH domain
MMAYHLDMFAYLIERKHIMSDSTKKQTNKSVGKNIRTLRHKHGWSQEDVANRLGISIPAFSKIETGVTDINLSRLEQIANIFEINVAQILVIDSEEIDLTPSNLSIAQKKLLDRESEIANLQRKVILLYEELRNKSILAL